MASISFGVGILGVGTTAVGLVSGVGVILGVTVTLGEGFASVFEIVLALELLLVTTGELLLEVSETFTAAELTLELIAELELKSRSGKIT